eukprot:2864592-Lingulodinium_polyedra.AAC.1
MVDATPGAHAEAARDDEKGRSGTVQTGAEAAAVPGGDEEHSGNVQGQHAPGTNNPHGIQEGGG